jgi:hypothetical protein
LHRPPDECDSMGSTSVLNHSSASPGALYHGGEAYPIWLGKDLDLAKSPKSSQQPDSRTLIPPKTLAEVIQQAIMTRTAFGIV